MKNVLLIVNTLLVIAVAYLLYEHFKGPLKVMSAANINASLTANGFKIAYIEMYSFQNQYNLLKEVRIALMAKDQEMGKELSNMENSLRNKYQELQKNGNSLSQAEIANRQQ
jgi:outer membrane protein